MNLELSDKRVFIAGASSGIGAAAARIFAEEGADVYFSYYQNAEGARRTADIVKVQGEIRVEPNQPFDISNERLRKRGCFDLRTAFLALKRFL